MDEQERITFRYSKEEHPELHEWISNQKNRTKSIIYVINQLIKVKGSDKDIIENILNETDIYSETNFKK